MSAIDVVREHLPDDIRPESAAIASAALARVERALRHLTAEHGTQCKCPGCEVLREAT